MAEFTGAYLALVKVMVSAELVARVRSRHVLISVDNTEVYHVMQIFLCGRFGDRGGIGCCDVDFVLLERLNVVEERGK